MHINDHRHGCKCMGIWTLSIKYEKPRPKHHECISFPKPVSLDLEANFFWPCSNHPVTNKWRPLFLRDNMTLSIIEIGHVMQSTESCLWKHFKCLNKNEKNESEKTKHCKLKKAPSRRGLNTHNLVKRG